MNVFTEQKVYSLECERIQRRMEKLKQLQQSQQSLTETTEKAKHTSDLLALLEYKAQVRDKSDQLLLTSVLRHKSNSSL